MRTCWRCCEHYSLVARLWQWIALTSVDTARAWDGDTFLWLAGNQILFCLLLSEWVSPVLPGAWFAAPSCCLPGLETGEQTTVAVWAERERAPNRQQTALGCHCPVFGADNPAQTKNNTGKLMDQCELCVAGSSLYMGWVRSHRESSMSHSESSAPVLYTVTAIDENNFMLSATSLLIGRPGVIVLHFLWFIILHKSLCMSAPALLSTALPSPATLSPEASPDLAWTRRSQRVMDGQNYVRNTFCCSRFIHHQEKTGWISSEVHFGVIVVRSAGSGTKVIDPGTGERRGREGPVSLGTQDHTETWVTCTTCSVLTP